MPLPVALAPLTGSQPSTIANSRISTGPSTRPGTESPNRLTTLNAWSAHLPRRTAANTPAGMASASATASAVSVNASV
jgi:hypothetical protein